jgi:hypothetical protein
MEVYNMWIVEDGSPLVVQKMIYESLEVKEFKCETCSCKYVAEKNEYGTFRFIDNTVRYQTVCPYCGSVSERAEIFEDMEKIIRHYKYEREQV